MGNLVLGVFFFKVLILENQKLPLASSLFVLDWSFAVTPIGQAEVQWLFILPDGPALISSPWGLYAVHHTPITELLLRKIGRKQKLCLFCPAWLLGTTL